MTVMGQRRIVGRTIPDGKWPSIAATGQVAIACLQRQSAHAGLLQPRHGSHTTYALRPTRTVPVGDAPLRAAPSARNSGPTCCGCSPRAAPLFPGIIGYEDTVVPQIINAVLARHDFILLGLRGQAKSRILRQLVELLDPVIPVVAGSEVNDDPFRRSRKFGRELAGRVRRRDADRLAGRGSSATSRSSPRPTSPSPT